MIIIDGDVDIIAPKKAVVTMGTFDGVHVGHQKILQRVINLASKIDGQSVVVTFWPHPRFVLKPDDTTLKLLTTFEEKANLLRRLGIDYLVKIPFTKALSEMASEDFIKDILINRLKTKVLVIGYDHKFGHNREGGFDYLKENESRFGFMVEEISRQDIDDVGVSSTKIRNALFSRDVQIANSFLGRSYCISGVVVEGNKLGRTIGFPTANIKLDQSYKLIPADGVYAVFVQLKENLHKAMLNIGKRPTINGTDKTIEAHLFDFNQDIYGQNVTVHFIAPIREEIKFADIASLKTQLASDKEEAIAILNTAKKV